MYKFDPAGEGVEAGFRSVALSQLDEALADLALGDGNGRSVVHEARRRCKKLRGLLRLVRPAFPDYARENAAIRDAAALLSHLRDAEVLKHTVNDLAGWRSSDTLRTIADRLAGQDTADQTERVEQFREQLTVVRGRVETWSLKRSGGDPLIAGLRLTFRDGRQQMHKAARTGAATDFHEWRKASKYHGFHIDLLKKTAPELLADDLKTVDELSLQLGLHHDLSVLKDATEELPDRFGSPDELTVLRDAIADRRQGIEARAADLGRQVFAERPRALARRFATYWASAR